MKIGILTAMSVEHDQLARQMENRTESKAGIYNYTLGNIAGNEIILLQCGIGKVNAAVGTAELIKTFSPDCIISTGVAGGIDKSLDIMDVVVSKQIWRITEDLITSMRRRLTDLEALVTDEILRSDKPQKNMADEDVNYTWNDYFGKENEE